MKDDSYSDRNNRMLWLALLAAPFFLNDFANIFIDDYRVWLTIDYLFVKALPLVLIIYLLQTKKVALADLGLKMPKVSQLAFWTIVTVFLGTAIDQVGWRFFEKILPDTKLGGMPRIPVPWLDKFDLYFGLLCVGIFEEVIFRGLAYRTFRKYSRSTAFVFFISSLIFGLIHWSMGLHAIVNTAIIGAVFMVVMWRTGSVVPTIIAHFFVNYVSFSGMIPYDSPWFNFLK